MYEIILKGVISLNEIEGAETINVSTLKPLLEDAGGQDLSIKINSVGGNVKDAFDMYYLLDEYRVKNKANITTITDEECASSAVILLLAGNERIVNNNSKPFVHEVYATVKGGADELINAGYEVEDTNFAIASLYSKRTNLDYEEARWFMRENKELTPDECFAFGIATRRSELYNFKESEKKKVLEKFNYKPIKTEIMTKEEKGILSSFVDAMKNLKETFSKHFNKKEMTSTDVEIDFPDVEDGSNPSVGDKATISGSAADGEYLMKSGKTYVFKNGVLDEIKEKEEVKEEVKELETKVEKLENEKKALETLNQKLTSEKSALETEVKSFKTQIEKFNALESEINVIVKNNQKSPETKEEEKSFTFGNSERMKKVNELKNKKR